MSATSSITLCPSAQNQNVSPEFVEKYNDSLKSVNFTTKCSMFNGKKRIYLISDDLTFTKNTVELIHKYTKTIDPIAELKFHQIKKIEDPLSLQTLLSEDSLRLSYRRATAHHGEFTNKVSIHDILPRAVRMFYGKHRIYANCHGSALLTSGMYPILRSQDHSPFRSWMVEKAEKISLENIDTGDLVFLNLGDHSFVFLSHELCLTTNGRGAPLELCRTTEVLKIYEYPADALKTLNPSKPVTIYRKKEGPNCYEEMMPSLTEYFDFYIDLVQADKLTQHPKYSRLDPIDVRLRAITMSVLQNPKLPKATKDLVVDIYLEARSLMPCDKTLMPYRQTMGLLADSVSRPPNATLTRQGGGYGASEKLKMIVQIIVVIWAMQYLLTRP